MSVTIEASDGTTQTFLRARLVAEEMEYDRRTTKVPYQTTLSDDHLLEGSGRRGPERLQIVAEVHASEIAKARIGVETIIDACEDAAVVSGPIGEWTIEGIHSVTRQPSENGYVLTIRLLAAQPRGSDYLRFIDGEVWGLR